MNLVNQQFEQERDLAKQRIKKLFDQNVRGRDPNDHRGVASHDGTDGHWLQIQFGLKADSQNAPDIFGFELKTGTRGKTTFGDWSADQYLFYSHTRCQGSAHFAAKCSKCSSALFGRSEFLKIFGTPNPKKGNRYSWSGEVFPKVSSWNRCGQKLIVETDGSVRALYCFEEDKRENKNSIVPKHLRSGQVTTALWRAATLRKRLESKFKVLGWVKCLRNSNGTGPYTSLVFGGPIDYSHWIKLVKTGDVYLDSGMYDGNIRPYQSWRANNSVWDSLIEEKY